MKYNNSRKIVFLPVLLGIALALGVVIGRFIPSDKDYQQHSSIQFKK